MTRRPARWTLFGACLAAGLLAATALPSSRSARVDSSLVARWPLDQIDASADPPSTPDTSGHGHSAEVDSVELATGRFGKALQLTTGNDFSGARVRNPDSSFAPQNLTVLAWVKRSGSPKRSNVPASRRAS